jgi:hypothetical protein
VNNTNLSDTGSWNGHLLTATPHQEVYAGDRPARCTTPAPRPARGLGRAWDRFVQDVEDRFDAARNPAIAAQILRILTHYALNLEAYDRERDFMIDYGIPEPEDGRFTPADAVR